jgi:hypothetical protein
MRTEGPAFSIIVPAFNAAGTIERCLQSVFAQTFANFELVLVDDASRDDTAAIVSRSTDPRLKLIRNSRNVGPAEARNRALASAEGSFILFVDADDWIEPSFLAEADAAMSGGADLLITGYRVVSENRNMDGVQRFSGGDALAGFLEDEMVTALWAKVFKRSIIEQHSIRCPSIRLMEDSAFLAAYMAHVQSVAKIETPLYVYDTRSASVTSALSVIDLLDETDRGLAFTAEALGQRRSAYARALRTREFRMLAMQVIRELARRQALSQGDPALDHKVRSRLWERLGLRVLSEANLRWTERAAYLLFLLMPTVTVRAVSARLAPREGGQEARLRAVSPKTSE